MVLNVMCYFFETRCRIVSNTCDKNKASISLNPKDVTGLSTVERVRRRMSDLIPSPKPQPTSTRPGWSKWQLLLRRLTKAATTADHWLLHLPVSIRSLHQIFTIDNQRPNKGGGSYKSGNLWTLDCRRAKRSPQLLNIHYDILHWQQQLHCCL